jgi:hypothetical protein
LRNSYQQAVQMWRSTLLGPGEHYGSIAWYLDTKQPMSLLHDTLISALNEPASWYLDTKQPISLLHGTLISSTQRACFMIPWYQASLLDKPFCSRNLFSG